MKKHLIIASFLFSIITVLGIFSNTYSSIVQVHGITQEDGSNVIGVDSDDFSKNVAVDNVDFDVIRTVQAEKETNDSVNASVQAEPSKVVSSEEFVLSIPSIGLIHEVKPDVDPRDKNTYLPVLENYIAHGMFTLHPDEAVDAGNVYLFAHRNGELAGRDFGYFARLDEIGVGDYAYIDYNGLLYTYKFRNARSVSIYDTSVYTSRADTSTLTMQTCEDNSLRRLIVWWDLVEVS